MVSEWRPRIGVRRLSCRCFVWMLEGGPFDTGRAPLNHPSRVAPLPLTEAAASHSDLSTALPIISVPANYPDNAISAGRAAIGRCADR
jgi:hypothetical protein